MEDPVPRDSWHAILGHMAVWAALYQCGALALVGGVLALDFVRMAYSGVGLIALSTYLKDRVKLHRAHLDPADAVAHPARAAYLRERAGGVRVVMVAALLGGMVCMWFVHPVLAVVGPAAWGGVIWYGRPRTGGARRPKDVLVIKNAIVSASIVGMIGTVLWFAVADVSVGLVVALGAMAVQVFGDAVVCDIDDRAGDERYGTRTIVVAKGTRAAWVVAFGAQGIASGAVITLGVAGLFEQVPALIWGVGGALGTVITAYSRAGARRDATDAKLAVVGGIALVVTVWLL